MPEPYRPPGDSGTADVPDRPRGPLLLRALVARVRLIALLAGALALIASAGAVRDRWAEWFPAPEGGHAGAGPAQYFCPMHPHVTAGAPSRCPTCGMPLSRRAAGRTPDTADLTRAVLTPERVAQAGIRTALAEWRPLVREVRASGVLRFDEAGVRRIGAGFAGVVTSLERTVDGATAPRGTPLLRVASAQLGALVESYRASRAQLDEVESRGASAAIERLRGQVAGLRRDLLAAGLSDVDLELPSIADDRPGEITLRAPYDCVVLHVEVAAGASVLPGTPLLQLADPARVTAVLDLARSDAASVRAGGACEILDPASPAAALHGEVTLVGPFVDEDSQTVPVRVRVTPEASGPRPGALVAARIRVPVAETEPFRSRAPAAGPSGPAAVARTVYECPMHQLVSDTPGTCDRCGGMTLLPREIPADPPPGHVLALPRAAVVATGERHLVFVEAAPGVFEARAVDVRPGDEAFVAVVSGVRAGDRVVAAGAFLLDAETRVQPGVSQTYFGASAPATEPGTRR